MTMSQIFLSHATEEHELVIHLANHLEKNNLKAWYAPRDIMGGIDYDKEIIAAIKDCRAFVLLLSKNSDASEDVKTEVYHAVKYKKQVICLDVDDVEPENLSYLLGMRHHLNWLERRDETLDKLIHDIKCISENDSDETTEPAIEAEKIEPEEKREPAKRSFKKILCAVIIFLAVVSSLIFFMHADRSEENSQGTHEAVSANENLAVISNDNNFAASSVKKTKQKAKKLSVRGKCVVVNVPEDDVLNMRKRPTMRSSVIARFNNGDILEINSGYKRSGSGTLWYNVTDSRTGSTGFVSSKYVRRLKDTDAN